MKITKKSTNTYNVLQVNSDKPAFVFGEFKEIRAKHGMSISKFEKCFACNHYFTNDESVYFACIEKKGNRFFCKDCAEKYKAE